MRLCPAEDRAAEPWKNGHGRTALVGEGDGWRISVAELRDGSPFSSFPGASRLLMPVSPPGVLLSVNGRRRIVGALEACAFDGEDAVSAPEVTEPVEVLNLIWQRNRCHGTLTALAVEGPLTLHGDGIALLAIVGDGRMTTADGAQCGHLDALWLSDGETARVSGHGELALVRVVAVAQEGPRPA